MSFSKGLELKKTLDRVIGIPLVFVSYAVDELAAFLGLRSKKASVDVQEILLCKLWGIGNLVMILPYLEAIQKRYPKASISFLTIAPNLPLLEGHPHLKKVYTIRAKGVLAPVFDLVANVFRLRAQRFDLFLDFEQFLRTSTLIGFFAGAKHRVGLATPGQGRARLYHAKATYRKDQHMTEVFGDVVRCAGVETTGLPPHWVPRNQELARRVHDLVQSLVPGSGPLLILHPGSGDHFVGRRWPAPRFAQLADKMIRSRGARVILTGTNAERDILLSVRTSMGEEATVAAGKFSIQEFIELIAQADLLVSNDTAPVHIAAAVQCPLVAIYGPNTPALYGPLHPASKSLYHPLPCSPCLSNLSAKTSRCRLPICIQSIEVGEVEAACEELLDRPAQRSRPRLLDGDRKSQESSLPRRQTRRGEWR